MALGSFDERDLLLPLYAGMDEEPLWETFLQRLLARTRARRIVLLVRPATALGAPTQRIVAAHGLRADIAFDIEALSDTGLLPYASLRPNRVYSLDETILRDSPETVHKQRAVLDAAEIADARFIRVVARGDHNAWLILLHDRKDFGAGDSALLSAIAPHLALAVAQLVESRTDRARASIAEEALALIGVGQAIFDADGRVVAADPIAMAELDVQAKGRPQIRAGAAQALNMACRELSGAPLTARRVIRIDERTGKDMLLRPAPVSDDSLTGRGYVIGLVRQPRREETTSAARVAAATLGLSEREGALAEGISRGLSILEAGAALQLTPETARNYTKRIYAKTGANGQADLVRLLLTGLTPFA